MSIFLGQPAGNLGGSMSIYFTEGSGKYLEAGQNKMTSSCDLSDYLVSMGVRVGSTFRPFQGVWLG